MIFLFSPFSSPSLLLTFLIFFYKCVLSLLCFFPLPIFFTNINLNNFTKKTSTQSIEISNQVISNKNNTSRVKKIAELKKEYMKSFFEDLHRFRNFLFYIVKFYNARHRHVRLNRVVRICNINEEVVVLTVVDWSQAIIVW